MKRYKHPLDSPNITLFEAICDMDNLKKAHQHAKRGKGWYKEVIELDKDLDKYLEILQNMLINKTYKTSDYQTFIKHDSGKDRLIYKLPYFPDRVCQWAIMQIIEPILIRQFTKDTYSAIPKRGIHQCLIRMKKAIKSDVCGTRYCLKLDVRKYYPSINHNILKQKYRELFKDKNLVWLLEEIIDSIPESDGVPIGNYLSQYSGNFYLSDFDHWIKEVKKIKYYYRYMDDIVILHGSKTYLHQLKKNIEEYMLKNLKLMLKDNWQIFPIDVRGVDFVGYRVFRKYTLLRKNICKNMKRKSRRLSKKPILTFNDRCSINSYLGWLKYCNGYRLSNKYLHSLTYPLPVGHESKYYDGDIHHSYIYSGDARTKVTGDVDIVNGTALNATCSVCVVMPNGDEIWSDAGDVTAEIWK